MILNFGTYVENFVSLLIIRNLLFYSVEPLSYLFTIVTCWAFVAHSVVYLTLSARYKDGSPVWVALKNNARQGFQVSMSDLDGQDKYFGRCQGNWLWLRWYNFDSDVKQI